MELLSEMEARYWAEEHIRESAAKKIIEDYKMGVCFWVMKDKNKINVSKMSDSHLINTKKMIKRNIKELSELTSITSYAWLTVFNAEITKRELLNN